MLIIKSKDIGINIKALKYDYKLFDKFVALTEFPLVQIKVDSANLNDEVRFTARRNLKDAIC